MSDLPDLPKPKLIMKNISTCWGGSSTSFKFSQHAGDAENMNKRSTTL